MVLSIHNNQTENLTEGRIAFSRLVNFWSYQRQTITFRMAFMIYG